MFDSIVDNLDFHLYWKQDLVFRRSRTRVSQLAYDQVVTEASMELVHLIYSSAATDINLSEDELNIILEKSRKNNESNDVSGVLLYEGGTFFQVLEGDRSIVDNVYKAIINDSRHTNVTKIIEETIKESTFGEWTMGYPTISKKDLDAIPGLNDFFMKGKSFSDLEEGRARKLLSAFKNGKWRMV